MPALARRRHDRLGERVLAALLDRGGHGEEHVLRESAHRLDAGELRLALGQGSGLVDDEGVDRRHPLQRLGVADEEAGLRAAAGRDHDRDRCREAEGAGAGNDQHAHRRHQRIGEGRRRAGDEPDGEGNQSHHDDGGHEYRRHPVGEALDRGARALRLGNHGDDAGEGGLGAGAVDLHVEAAGGVLRAAGDAVAFVLLDRDRLAGDERLVDRASAVDDDAIDRHPVAGAHAQHVTDHDIGERHLGRVAVRLDLQRRLGREVEEGADCTAGLRPRPEFQHLAEKDEGGDHRRRLEIDADQAVMVAHLGRKDLRREHRDQAVRGTPRRCRRQSA